MKNLNNVKTYQDFLIDKLNEIEDSDLLTIYNQVLNDHDYIFDNTNEEPLNSLFSSPIEAIKAVCYGNYKYMSPYAKIAGDGNLESIYNLKDAIFIDELAENIVYQNYDYFIDEYKTYLDEISDNYYDHTQKLNKKQSIKLLNLIKDKKKEANPNDHTYKDFLKQLETYIADHLYENLDVKNAYDLI